MLLVGEKGVEDLHSNTNLDRSDNYLARELILLYENIGGI